MVVDYVEVKYAGGSGARRPTTTPTSTTPTTTTPTSTTATPDDEHDHHPTPTGGGTAAPANLQVSGSDVRTASP